MNTDAISASILSLALATCTPNPVQVVPIPTGITDARVILELHVEGLDDGRYVVTASGPRGKKSFGLCRDADTAQRASFYLIGNDRLYVYGTGGQGFIYIEKGDVRTSWPATRNIAEIDGSTWRYIGSVDRIEHTSKLRFYPPDQQAECAIYADLGTPYLAAVYKRNIPTCANSPKGWRD